MIHRQITNRIRMALRDMPVVIVTGARQVGKSHLVKSLITRKFNPQYLTMDRTATYRMAKDDPDGFINGLALPVIIDEVQMVPALFRSIKARVDQERKPGMFLLTGSANIMVIPKASESLAGRMETIRLMPFSQDEINSLPAARFIDMLLKQRLSAKPGNITKEQISRALVYGGYPVPLLQIHKQRWQLWFQSYIDSLVQRDVRDISQIEHLHLMPRLLALIAARSGTMMNTEELSRSVGIPTTTLKRYLTLLEAVHLVLPLQAYARNYSKRVTRTPKIFLNDSGLMTALLNFDAQSISRMEHVFGQVLETFVGMELLKQMGWSNTHYRLYYYRTHAGAEVDFVAETSRGIVGIEVKATTNIGRNDFRGLDSLAEEVGKDFVRGVILYLGSDVVPRSANRHAIPLTNLWQNSG